MGARSQFILATPHGSLLNLTLANPTWMPASNSHWLPHLGARFDSRWLPCMGASFKFTVATLHGCLFQLTLVPHLGWSLQTHAGNPMWEGGLIVMMSLHSTSSFLLTLLALIASVSSCGSRALRRRFRFCWPRRMERPCHVRWSCFLYD